MCIHCRRRKGYPAQLPFGIVVSLCHRCRGAAFIAAMREIVAHG